MSWSAPATASIPDDEIKNMLIEFCKSVGQCSKTGASTEEIAAHLRSSGHQVPDSKLCYLLESLVYDGYLYTKSDENHFLSTL